MKWKSAEHLLNVVRKRERLILFVLDTEGTVLLSEGAGLQLLGVKPGELVGQSSFHLNHDDPHNIDSLKRAISGESFVTMGAFGGGRFVEVQYEPWYHEDGRLGGTIGVAIEVTAREKSLLEKDFLIEASKVLSESLDYQVTLDRVSRLCIPVLADFCTLYVAGEDGRLQMTGAAHVDPLQEDLLFEFQRRYLHDHSPDTNYAPLRVYQTGKSEMYPVFGEEGIQKISSDEREITLLRKLDPTSLICVALIARSRKLGLLVLARGKGSAPYGNDDLRLAEEVARRAAMAVDNALLFKQASK